MSRTTVSGVDAASSVAGGLDVFVFRRVADGVYAHLGGRGRGEGWAGIVTIDVDEEVAIAEAVADQVTVEHDRPEPTRIFGPYWSTEGVIVPFGRDELVVIGGPGTLSLTPAQRTRQARAVSDLVGDVSPAKRLADELELLHAVKAVALTPLTTLDAVARTVLAEAAAALSCELAVLHLPATDATFVHDRDAPQPVSADEAVAFVTALAPMVGGSTRCFQELADDHRRRLPAASSQVVSLLGIPLDLEPGAMLLLAHTTGGPRGFTDLCRDIAGHVAEAARTVLLAAMQHDQLVRQVEDARTRANTDELTGLLNRRGWETALDAVADDADQPVAVLLADGNDLKRVNDRDGHAVGDLHIRTWAEAFRTNLRDTDALARIGGDEFGVLLVGPAARRGNAVADAVRATLHDAPFETSVAIGVAVGRGTDLERLVREADEAMYRDKGHRARCC